MRYLKSYLKFLGRNKFYTVVNAVGLSLSFCFLILLSGYLYSEFTVDVQVKNADRIMLLANETDTYNAFMLGEFLEERVPWVEGSCAYYQIGKCSVTINGKKIDVEKSAVVSSNFLDLFSFRLVEGERSMALESANSVLVSRSFARRAFGEENALEQVVSVDWKGSEREFAVGGVIEDFENSIFPQCDLIYQQDALKLFNPNSLNQSLNYLAAQVFILTGENAKVSESELLILFQKDYWYYTDQVPWGACKEVNLIPLREVYFQKDINVLPLRTNNRMILIILVITCVIILGFSILNYLILTIAQTGFRANEMVVNKLYGASRMNILLRITFESAGMFLVAVVVGFVLALGLESTVNRLIGENIDLWKYISVVNVLGGMVMISVLGMAVGVIPGVIVSRYKPIEIFKGKFVFNMKMYYSRIFILIQSFVNILLITASIVIGKQMNYLLNFDYGYNHKNIIELSLDSVEPQKDELLKERIRSVAGVKSVGMAAGTPYGSGLGLHAKVNGLANAVYMEMLSCDRAVAQMFDYKIIQDNMISGDGAWINEAMVKVLGGDSQVVEISIPDFNFKFNVAGIVKNFYMSSVLDDNGIGYAPVFMLINEKVSDAGSLLVETEGESREVLRRIQEMADEVAGGAQIQANYVSSIMEQKFSEQRKVRNLIGIFTILSFVISIMGLFAISSYYIKQKSKEISVRSVLGATPSELFRMLVFYFLKLVVAAFAVACPVAIFGLNKWLGGFEYHISLSIWIFLESFCMVLCVSFLTVYWQSYNAVQRKG